MSDLLNGLNHQQAEAVTATEGYVRVIAGAGAGKTKALTHRYAYLVKAGGIHPRNVLCVTFTNKAAGEMKRRVRQLVGDGYDTSLITTYHGFCVRVLRPDMDKLFYPQNFLILDTGDQKNILEEIYEELDIKMDYASFQKSLRMIGLYKADITYVGMLTDPGYVFPVCKEDDIDTQIIRKYLQKQKKVFGLDFDDLVNFVFYLFDKHPEVRDKWAEQLHYIQVDEFQDSSSREMKLLDMLCASNGNVFVVGDPDQNIYEWRGARVEILVDFDKTHAGTQTIILNQNYRSTPQILDVANSLIEKNKNRVKKDLFTHKPDGTPVIHLHAKDEKSEAEWMVAQIRQAVKEGRKHGDFAMLYRASFLSRYLEQALLADGIPYQVWGGVRFFDRMEIRDMMAYMRMAVYRDDISFLRIVNVPRRRMGKRRIEHLKMLAQQTGRSLFETLAANLKDRQFAGTGAADFVSLVECFKDAVAVDSPSDLAERLLTQSGYERYIRQSGDMERLDNLAELLKTITEYERASGEPVLLEEYLQYASLQRGSDNEDELLDHVKLMTIHASKGLEFPVVFVVGMNEGIMPSARTLEERMQAGLEEERRLCFVAMTRAMERLFLTESEGFSVYGGTRKLPSRFLFDISEGLYERVGVIPQDLIDEMRKKTGMRSAGGIPRLESGAHVSHPIFGNGVITEVDETKGVYQVKFDKTGKLKPIQLDYAFASEPICEEETPDEYETLLPSEIVCPDRSGEAKRAEAEIPSVEETFETEVTTLEKEATHDSYETNLWKRADVPHSGWTNENIIDLGEPSGVCGMCGHQIIRYVHIMKHPMYPRAVGAGNVCAGRMEGNPENAARRERDYKNTQARLEKFMTRKWKKSAKGNLYLKYKDRVIILLADKYRKGQWKYTINGKLSPLFPTREAAMRDAFDKVSLQDC